MKTWKAMVVGVLIGFLAGVGTMQATLIGDVREHGARITKLDEEVRVEADHVHQRIERITRLMESILESNRQLVAEISAERHRRNP